MRLFAEPDAGLRLEWRVRRISIVKIYVLFLLLATIATFAHMSALPKSRSAEGEHVG